MRFQSLMNMWLLAAGLSVSVLAGAPSAHAIEKTGNGGDVFELGPNGQGYVFFDYLEQGDQFNPESLPAYDILKTRFAALESKIPVAIQSIRYVMRTVVWQFVTPSLVDVPTTGTQTLVITYQKKQVALSDTNRLVVQINKPIWDQLSNLEQAYLLLHEAFWMVQKSPILLLQPQGGATDAAIRSDLPYVYAVNVTSSTIRTKSAYFLADQILRPETDVNQILLFMQQSDEGAYVNDQHFRNSDGRKSYCGALSECETPIVRAIEKDISNQKLSVDKADRLKKVQADEILLGARDSFSKGLSGRFPLEGNLVSRWNCSTRTMALEGSELYSTYSLSIKRSDSQDGWSRKTMKLEILDEFPNGQPQFSYYSTNGGEITGSQDEVSFNALRMTGPTEFFLEVQNEVSDKNPEYNVLPSIVQTSNPKLGFVSKYMRCTLDEFVTYKSQAEVPGHDGFFQNECGERSKQEAIQSAVDSMKPSLKSTIYTQRFEIIQSNVTTRLGYGREVCEAYVTVKAYR